MDGDAGEPSEVILKVPLDRAFICKGHEELRDIVIETRNDVKHIVESLKKGDDTMERHEIRSRALESADDQRKGYEEAITKIAMTRATIVSIIIGIATLIVTFAYVVLVWTGSTG
jgi:hypothetical protein